MRDQCVARTLFAVYRDGETVNKHPHPTPSVHPKPSMHLILSSHPTPFMHSIPSMHTQILRVCPRGKAKLYFDPKTSPCTFKTVKSRWRSFPLSTFSPTFPFPYFPPPSPVTITFNHLPHPHPFTSACTPTYVHRVHRVRLHLYPYSTTQGSPTCTRQWPSPNLAFIAPLICIPAGTRPHQFPRPHPPTTHEHTGHTPTCTRQWQCPGPRELSCSRTRVSRACPLYSG